MATFTRDWNEALPDDNTVANQIDEYNRYLRVDVSDRVKDMIYGFTAGENDGVQGFKELTFKQQAAAAGQPNADEIVLYAIDDGSACGLYAKQEDNYVKQILKKSGTSLILNCEAGDYTADSIDEDDIRLANNAYLTGRNAANDDDINIIKVNASDVPEILVGSVLSASTAPAVDAGVACKKYVDDEIDTAVAGSGFLKNCSVTPFNTTMTAAATMQDLDLSGTVGSAFNLVYLEITASTACQYCVMQKAANGAWANRVPGATADVPYGTGYIDFVDGNHYANVIVMTNGAGVISHGCSSSSVTITVRLTGYIK